MTLNSLFKERVPWAGALLIAGLLVGCSQQKPEDEAPTSSSGFALTNVQILSMESGEALSADALVVRDGVVEWLGSGSPPNAEDLRTIDGRGGWVMPGLIDMHVHLADREELDLYLLNGVTSVVNLSGQPLHLEMRREVDAGTLRGPRIYTAGRTIDGDPPRNPRFIGLGDPAMADALVGEQIDEGYDFIKIYDLIEQEAYEAAVEAARSRSIPVVGHIPKAFGLEPTLTGHDLIAHAEEYYYTFFDNTPDRERIAEAARLTADAGVAVCPNTGFIDAIIQQAEEIDAVMAWPEVRYLPAASYVSWLAENNRYTQRPPEWLARIKVMHPFLLELTKGLHEAGVQILVGTDASVPGGVPGFALRREIESLEQAGLSRLDALRAATIEPASWLAEHLGDLSVSGEIAVGKRADLVVLAEDPRISDEPYGAIRSVVAAGEWYDESELRNIADRRAEGYAEEIARYEDFKALVEMGDREAAGVLLMENASGVLPERVVNSLGYYYLYRAQKAETAITVLQLNADTHPESANVWDSLGEAQKVSGDLDSALVSYRRALELDPESEYAAERVEELTAATAE